MRAYRAKKTAMITVRVMQPFKDAIRTWAPRAGITQSEFIMMALVHGVRKQAVELGVYRKDDDLEIEKNWRLLHPGA